MEDLQARWAGIDPGQWEDQDPWQQPQNLSAAFDSSQELTNRDLCTYIELIHRDLDVTKQTLRETKEKLDAAEMSYSELREDVIRQHGLIQQLFAQNTNLSTLR